MRVLFPLVAVAVVACKPEDTGHDLDYSAYTPFDEAHLAAGLAHCEAHATIATVRGDATLDNHADVYADILDLYEADGLADRVIALEDAHIDLDGYGMDDAGAFLDGHIIDAIQLGAGATEQAHLDWAGQTADKALFVYFAIQTYAAAHTRTQEGLDDAYAQTGLALDGTATNGLAANAAGREDEFGATLLRPQFEAFVDAHHAMERGTEDSDTLGDDAEYDDAIAVIDTTIIETLGLYVAHEASEIPEEEPDVKLIEARVAWEAVAPWAESVAPTETATMWSKLYPAGVPARDAEGYFWSGLPDVRNGTTTIDVAGLNAALTVILGEL